MAKEKIDKIVLERLYIIPLRRKFLKVPRYKRAKKAVKAIREFLVRHMKVYDRDLRKIKIDLTLNNELRFRGMKKPPAKINVKATKFESGIVRVELSKIPQVVKYRLAREEKQKAESEKAKKKKEAEKKAVEEAKKTEEAKKKEETVEDKVEKEEKKEAGKEAGIAQAEKQAKQTKHQVKQAKGPKHQHRKALAK